MIKQAIIPLAGQGTRLLPLTSVISKELLPINGKPGLEYIMEECIDAGIKEVIFVISKKKSLVKKDIPFYLSIGYDITSISKLIHEVSKMNDLKWRLIVKKYVPDLIRRDLDNSQLKKIVNFID